MQVLLTERSSPAAHDTARALRDAGHVVHHCYGEHDQTNCVADLGARCPLDVAAVDVVVALKAAADGERCGRRRKIPVVRGAAGDGDAVLAAVTAAAREPLRAHTIVATDAFRRSLTTAGLPADGHADVRRAGGYLKVTLDAPFPVPEPVAQRAAVRICQVLREIDTDARGIDVASPVVRS